jgi:hypothetical protein
VKLAILIGLSWLSSQWNFRRKMHKWPASWITVSSMEICLVKSSCLLRMHVMQQLLFLKGHPGAHFACRSRTLNPHSLRVCWSPFGSPDSVIIFLVPNFRKWIRLWYNSVLLTLLRTSMRLVHFKGFEGIRWQQSMSRWLIKNKKSLTL